MAHRQNCIPGWFIMSLRWLPKIFRFIIVKIVFLWLRFRFSVSCVGHYSDVWDSISVLGCSTTECHANRNQARCSLIAVINLKLVRPRHWSRSKKVIDWKAIQLFKQGSEWEVSGSANNPLSVGLDNSLSNSGHSCRFSEIYHWSFLWLIRLETHSSFYVSFIGVVNEGVGGLSLFACNKSVTECNWVFQLTVRLNTLWRTIRMVCTVISRYIHLYLFIQWHGIPRYEKHNDEYRAAVQCKNPHYFVSHNSTTSAKSKQ